MNGLAQEIDFQIPRVLRQYSGGRGEFRLIGSNVQAVLGDLERKYPDVHVCVCDETGALRRHLKVFVNDRMLLDAGDFELPLKANDVVSIFQAVSGG